jgi:hypothetical protein
MLTWAVHCPIGLAGVDLWRPLSGTPSIPHRKMDAKPRIVCTYFLGLTPRKLPRRQASLDTWLQSTCLEQVNGKPLPAHRCSPGTSNQSTDNVVPSHCLYRTYRPLLELNLVNFVHACLLGLAHVLSVNKTLSE